MTATFQVFALSLIDQCLQVAAVFSKLMTLEIVQYWVLQYIRPARKE